MKDCVVRIFGNLGETEVRYTPQGKFVFTSSVATNKGKGDDKITSWFKITAWEKAGELMNDLCKKGTGVFVEGELVLRPWTDKNGEKHISPEVTVSDFRVLARRKEKEEQVAESATAEEDEFLF